MLSALAPASADAAGQEPVPDRIINLVVFGDDACPKSTEDEIVVCARRPESERYRIPKALRKKEERAESSWAARNEDLEEASRPSRPGSCSVEGSYGQSGCLQQMLNHWFRERRAARSGNAR
jgi:hypothetical protein